MRDPTLPNHQTPYPTLGELLRQKAEEGVQVLLMVRRQGFRVWGFSLCPIDWASLMIVVPRSCAP